MEVEADVEDHELDQPAGVDEDSDDEGIAPRHTTGADAEGADEEFSRDRDDHDQAAQEPKTAAVEQSDAGAQSGVGKE